jgi:ADP-heptose:LPS heptosyltransferase
MVLSTPALKAIKERYPAAELCVLAAPFPAGILEGLPYVDKVLVWRPEGLLAALKTANGLRAENFDLVIDPYCGHELRTALIAFLSGAPFRAGYDIAGRGVFFDLPVDPSAGKGHFVDEAFGVLKAVGVAGRASDPELRVADRGEAEARAMLAGSGAREGDLLVSVHPGGHYPSQRWPAQRFAEVIKALIAAHKARIALIGASSEPEAAGAVLAALGGAEKGNIIMAQDLPAGTLCALIARSRLFIGNNSGPLHVAAALKVPSVSTMGPTDPVKWTPIGAGQTVLRTALPCAGCGKGKCTAGCMLDISVGDVLAAAERALQ